MAAIARGLTVTVRDAVLLLFMMAFTSAGLVQAQESESSPEAQEEQTAQEAAGTEAKPGPADTLPPVEVLQETDTEAEPKPEAEPAAEPQPAVRPRPITTTAVPKTRQATAQVQTAVPSPLQQPEPEGVERGTEGGEPTAYSPVEGYVATRSATGTKTDTPLIETPQSISVIGVEQMQDQGVQTLDEAVRYTPGVFANGFGVDTRNDNVIIRGTEGSVFIDGLSTGIQGGIYQNTIPIEPYALERIEVLRGPSAMLYGATSAGGIVNGISKRPTLEPFAEAGVDYGSFDFRQLRGDLSGPLFENSDFYYRITGLGRLADTQVDYVDNDRWMLQPSIAYRPNEDIEVLLLGNFQRDDSGSTAQFFPLEGTLYPNAQGRKIPRDTFAGIPTDHYDTEQQSGTLLVDKKLNSGLKFHTGMRYTHTNNNYDSTYPAALTSNRLNIINAPFEGFLGVPLVIPDYAPYLNAEQTELARLRYVSEVDTRVFSSDTYLTGEFDTGKIQHEVTGGGDYMSFRESSADINLIDNLLTASGVDPAAISATEALYLDGAFSQIYPLVYSEVAAAYGPFLPFFLAEAAQQASSITSTLASDFVAGLGIDRNFVLNQAGYPGTQRKYNVFKGNHKRSSYQIDIANLAAVDPKKVKATPNPDQAQFQTGLYIQDQLRLGNWIGIAGIRQDWVDIGFKGSPDTHEQATSGRAALMYEFDAGIAPYVSWSQSFTPQPGVIVSDTLFVRTNGRAATPREGNQIEVGLKIQPRGSRFAVNLAAYELNEENLVASPDTLFETLIGAARRVRGFEFEAIGNLTDELVAIASYTYTDAVFTDYPDPLAYKIGTQDSAMPEHLASLWGIYTFSRGWLDGFSVGAGVRYIGEVTDVGEDLFTGRQFSVTTPSATLFDASIGYETDHWRWAVTAQNLEDELYLVSCGAFTLTCGIGQARTVIGSATYKF
jgi:outer membrane receptor protein involved in Fe transport